MRKKRGTREHLTEEQRRELIAFLRDWLPAEARTTYREMIRASPHAWWYDPHFEGGIILDFALRGNGYTEKALRVRDLAPLWPDLLKQAVSDDSMQQAEIDHA